MRDSDEGFMDGLTDSQLQAMLIVEEDERFEREGEAFLARVRSFVLPDEDDDADKDGGLGSGDWLKRWRDQ